MKVSKGSVNTISSLFSQLLIISVGIIVPRLVIINLGSEANGLLSSIGNTLSYLSLLEAGIGLASLQVLYRPVAENDMDQINAIMSATDYYYRKTGAYYSIAILLISIVYSLTIKTSFSRTTVLFVVLLAGIPSIINYLFQGKLRIFLMAEGKNYVITIISTTFSVLSCILKAILLLCGFDIIGIQVLHFIIAGIQVLVYIFYFKKRYPWLNTKVKPDLQAVSQRKAVLVHQISELVFNHTDILLLTFFTDLKVVSVYSMYAMIYGMMKAVAVSFSDGYTYKLGQNYYNRKLFHVLFDMYEVFNMTITFAVFCIGYNLMLPFLTLYTRGVIDINYLDTKINLLFVLFYLLQNARKSSATIISVAQKFEETKWWSFAEAIINLVTSLILTYFYGIYGVLAGSIIALLFRTLEMIWFSAKLLDRTMTITISRWIVNLALFIFLSFILHKMQFASNNYWALLGQGFVYSVIISIVYFLSTLIFYRNQVKEMMTIVKKRIHRNNG